MKNLFQSSNYNLDEIVFEQRNKAYGAYAIRKAYPNTLNKSMAIALSPLLFAFAGLLVWNLLQPDVLVKKALPKVPPLPPDIISCGNDFVIVADALIDELSFRIVKDKDVVKPKPKPEKIKPVEKIIHAIVASGGGSMSAGMMGALPAIGGVPGGIPGGVPGGIAGGEKNFVDFVENMPEFPGGLNAMYAFIANNMKYPSYALENGIQGRVMVSFVIMEDGSIDLIQVEQGIGYGCDEEAARVLREMPSWTPGNQNGHNVAVRMRLPILFQYR